MVEFYRRHFVHLELEPITLKDKNGNLRYDQRELEELVSTYRGDLSAVEWLPPILQRLSILPWQAIKFAEHRTYTKSEDKFLQDFLSLTGQNVKEYLAPEQKAVYARWACATAAIELLKGAKKTDNQEISELLSLTARKTIFIANDATQYYEGRGIDREWLNGFIKENILGSTDGSNLASKFENFINDPPRTPH
jgi:hypothetical protein